MTDAPAILAPYIYALTSMGMGWRASILVAGILLLASVGATVYGAGTLTVRNLLPNAPEDDRPALAWWFGILTTVIGCAVLFTLVRLVKFAWEA